MNNTDTSVAVANLFARYGQDFMSFNLDKMEQFARDVQRITNQRIRQVQRMSERQLRTYGAVPIGQTPVIIGGTQIYRTVVQDGHRVRVPVMRTQYKYSGALTTYNRIMKTGGPISLAKGRAWSASKGYYLVINQNKNQRLKYLQHEVSRGLDFITSQTSSPTGRRKWHANAITAVTKLLPMAEAARFTADLNANPELLSLFWEAYREATNQHYSELYGYDSDRVVAAVYDIMQSSRQWSKAKQRYTFGGFDYINHDASDKRSEEKHQHWLSDVADATAQYLDPHTTYSAREAYRVSRAANAADRKAAADNKRAAKEAKSKR